jgi:glycine/D-amino acid oxidase-like deaminating enzyme
MSTNPTVACDVLVIGAGAAGMAAAVTARHHGLDVIVTEKAQALGGASALSGGNLWIPANPQARRLGIDDSSDAARRYLAHEMGNRFDPERVDAFLENAPRMLEFFEKKTAVRFFCRYNYPDYHPEAEGGMMAGGRTICAEPFDARALGAYLGVLRRPLRTETLMGMMTTPLELPHYYNALRSPRSFFYVGARLLSHAWDMLRHGRAMRLTNGNALAARLVKSLLDLGVPLWLSSPARELVVTQGAVTGALVETENGLAHVEARRGVVLACGGFPCAAKSCCRAWRRPWDISRWDRPRIPATGFASRKPPADSSIRARATRRSGLASRVCRSPAAPSRVTISTASGPA